MKFGEQLLAQLTPEWSSQYINYEYMKELLSQAIIEAPMIENDVDNLLREQYFLSADKSFFEYCHKQVTKIDTFFAEKIAEAMRRYETLKDELHYTKSILEKVLVRRTSVAANQEININMNHNGDVNAVSNLVHRSSLVAPLSRILPDRLVPKTDDEHTKLKQYKNKRKLKVAFSEVYLMLILLQKFQVLNYTGFRKIMKKHDKLFQTTRGEEWQKLYIDTASFHTSTKVTDLIGDVETLYTDTFEDGDRSRAMKRLRVPPLEEKQSPVVTFRVGIFLGMICMLIPILFVVIVWFNIIQSDKPVAWRKALALYRSSFLIILQIILSGINVYGWSTAGVNHILIFEIDPRHHLTYQRLLEIGMSLSVLWLLNFIIFVITSYLDFYPFIQPFIFVIFIVIFLINPAPIFYRRARYWLIKHLARVFSSPFHAVGFTDFWLAEQLTSLELVFFDLEYFFCFYLSNRSWWTSDLTSPASVQGIFCTNWTKFFLQTFLLILPSWFRFAQCLRRYRDTKHAFPHLANAGKYATAFFVAITNSVRRATSMNYSQNLAANPYLYLWIVAALIASTYRLIWDLKMDWGFFHKNAGENKYLRDQIVYRPKIYYYIGIIVDILFRYIWMINIFLNFDTDVAEYGDIPGFSFGLVDVFRRFLWNFFRVENEHLNNCGEFRAVRDISIAPLLNKVDYALIAYKLHKEPGIRYRRKIVPMEMTTVEEETSTIDDTTMSSNRSPSPVIP